MMAPIGNKCGNKLFYGYVCRSKEGHMCSCPLKWTIDPGCGHMLTGSCSQSFSEAITIGCLAPCGRVLECEHTCKEACLCVCPYPDCDGMSSLANQVAHIAITPTEVELENVQNTANSGSEVELEASDQASVRTPLQNLFPLSEMSTVNPQPILAPLQPREYGSALLARAGNSIGKNSPQTSKSRAAFEHENAEFFWNEAMQPRNCPYFVSLIKSQDLLSQVKERGLSSGRGES